MFPFDRGTRKEYEAALRLDPGNAAIKNNYERFKALEKKNLPVDGPFNLDRRGLIEQRRWTLSLDLSVVSAATGETLYKKTFREERDYIDPDKPAEFAFAELADRIRPAFSRSFSGPRRSRSGLSSGAERVRALSA